MILVALCGPAAWAMDERAIGREITRALYASPDRVNHPILLAGISRMLQPIHQASELRTTDLTLVLLNNAQLNAFAAPGGVIGLHTGLLTQAERADQVASVIAHEVAHISQRHFARRMDGNSRIQAAYALGTLAALAAGLAGDPTAGAAAFSTTQAAAIDATLAFSREHEREADRVGLGLMEQAGFDSSAMAEMFAVMQRAQELAGEPLAWLSTHPLSSERVADTRDRNPSAAQVGSVNQLEYEFWQRLAAGSVETLTLQDIETQSPPSSRLRYQLLAAHYLAQGQSQQARQILDEAKFSYPSDYALAWYRAELLADENPTRALRELDQLGQQHRYFAQPYERAVEIARNMNWQPEFYFYSGWAAQRSGREQQAQEYWRKAASQSSPYASRARALLKPES